MTWPARPAARLATLAPGYQRGVSAEDYEVIAVDAGSAAAARRGRGGKHRVPAPGCCEPRPRRLAAAAVNTRPGRPRGTRSPVSIDGARMMSPGIIAGMLAGLLRVFPDPVVATLAWHLGPKVQNESILEGYDQAAEDAGCSTRRLAGRRLRTVPDRDAGRLLGVRLVSADQREQLPGGAAGRLERPRRAR